MFCGVLSMQGSPEGAVVQWSLQKQRCHLAFMFDVVTVEWLTYCPSN